MQGYKSEKAKGKTKPIAKNSDGTFKIQIDRTPQEHNITREQAQAAADDANEVLADIIAADES